MKDLVKEIKEKEKEDKKKYFVVEKVGDKAHRITALFDKKSRAEDLMNLFRIVNKSRPFRRFDVMNTKADPQKLRLKRIDKWVWINEKTKEVETEEPEILVE